MLPKVSICIPAYKRVPLLRKAMESVLEQTFSDYEIIITDDTPDDSIKKLVEEFDFKGKLKYYHNETRLGPPANWNYSIEKAEGEYIKILHCDDYFTTPLSLEKYVQLLNDNPKANLGFSSTHVVFLLKGKDWIHHCSEKQYKKITKTPEYLFFKNMIGSPSATIYRKKVNKVFDINLKWLVDVDFYITLLNENCELAHSLEPLICTVNEAEEQVTLSVKDDKTIQIKEHILVFQKILTSGRKIRLNKFSVFFQLLFTKYNVKSIAELNKIIPIQSDTEYFLTRVMSSVKNGMLFTRILAKFYHSRLNQYIFKIE